MKLARVLAAFAIVLLITACPAITERPTADMHNDRLGHAEVELSLSVDENGLVVLELDYGTLVLADVGIAVRATSLSFNAEECNLVTGGVDCTPGAVEAFDGEEVQVMRPEDSPYRLYFRGTDIVASASFNVVEDGTVNSRSYFELFIVE